MMPKRMQSGGDVAFRMQLQRRPWKPSKGETLSAAAVAARKTTTTMPKTESTIASSKVDPGDPDAA